MAFDYLIEKIHKAEFEHQPFKHVYLDEFFSPEHFTAITRAREISIPAARDDADLFEKLFSSGYKIIEFPGCVTDQDQYVKWHKERRVDHTANTACEGFGMTLRLMAPSTPLISDLHAFLVGDDFRDALASKFGITLDQVIPDSGIQKYLDGYEISPHPDIRRKALTYMVNINPHANSEQLDHHTHYLTFDDQHRYIQAFWEGNSKADRCWVPWDWCKTETRQTRNNSIVIFAPGNDTVHAVRANYDHHPAQRTQLYGNLWLKESPAEYSLKWEDLVISPAPQPRRPAAVAMVGKAKSVARRVLGSRKREPGNVAARFY